MYFLAQRALSSPLSLPTGYYFGLYNCQLKSKVIIFPPSKHLHPKYTHKQAKQNQKMWLHSIVSFENLGSSKKFYLFTPHMFCQFLSPANFPHEKFPLSVLLLHPHSHVLSWSPSSTSASQSPFSGLSNADLLTLTKHFVYTCLSLLCYPAHKSSMILNFLPCLISHVKKKEGVGVFHCCSQWQN